MGRCGVAAAPLVPSLQDCEWPDAEDGLPERDSRTLGTAADARRDADDGRRCCAAVSPLEPSTYVGGFDNPDETLAGRGEASLSPNWDSVYAGGLPCKDADDGLLAR